jgi:hypothetical protein
MLCFAALWPMRCCNVILRTAELKPYLPFKSKERSRIQEEGKDGAFFILGDHPAQILLWRTSMQQNYSVANHLAGIIHVDQTTGALSWEQKNLDPVLNKRLERLIQRPIVPSDGVCMHPRPSGAW